MMGKPENTQANIQEIRMSLHELVSKPNIFTYRGVKKGLQNIAKQDPGMARQNR